MKKDVKPIVIYLTANQVRKLEVAKTSIIDPVSCKDIIDGLIDSAYLVALNTLYDEGIISKKTYKDGLTVVPDCYLWEI